jgi:hypothetical protein
MISESSDVSIQILADPGTDDQDLSELALRLRAELSDLGIGAAVPTAERAPAGAKGIGLAAIGGLVAQVAPNADTLRAVVSCIRTWAGRQRVSSVRLTLDGDTCEVTGVPSAELQKLIDLWIARHAGTG